MTASYRIFVDYAAGGTVFPAGTILTAGREVPSDWQPILGCDPLDGEAAQAFFNMGPRGAAGSQPGIAAGNLWGLDRWTNDPIAPPATYWISVPYAEGIAFRLTGLGQNLGVYGN